MDVIAVCFGNECEWETWPDVETALDHLSGLDATPEDKIIITGENIKVHSVVERLHVVDGGKE